MDLAQSMAACAAERALTEDWESHPVFGISVSKDKWALCYQDNQNKLKAMLKDTEFSMPEESVKEMQPARSKTWWIVVCIIAFALGHWMGFCYGHLRGMYDVSVAHGLVDKGMTFEQYYKR